MKFCAFPVFRIIFAVIALAVACAVFIPAFSSWENLSNILLASTTLCLLAVAASFVIGSSGIDLSVGSVMAVSAIGAVTVAQHFLWPWYLIPFLCLLIGLGCGFINGYLIGYRNLPPFIVTLGGLGIFRGLALIAGNGRSIYGLDNRLLFLGQGEFLQLPVPVLIVVAVIIFAWLLLHCTSFGVHNAAIGDNSQAARFSGINVKNHMLWLYGFSGVLAAIAGLVFMTRINAADPNAGYMSELTAITAAIIGGASLSGGKSSVTGALLGALVMGILQNGLTLLNVPSYYQQVAIGAILIATVALKGKRHAA
jgi:ribose/xylose/arabinose/galactoside ABC-type transport system permease subunit